MEKHFAKGIFISYLILLFLLPITVIPITSELFEFNKIVLVYLSSVVITSLWLARMVSQRKIIFQKTTLNLPILAFIIANLASALFSVDRNMSVFGYYSRFNGGILSLLSYSLLYFAFVSNLNKKQTILILKTTVASTILVLCYAILQKFGIDKNIWIQDAQARVFSTFGQPNWLAAFLVITFPITIALSFKEPKKQKYYLALSLVYFLVILFTKSRSGLLGFAAANTIFWIKTAIYHKETVKPKLIITYHLLLALIIITAGTPWTPSVATLLQRKDIVQETKTGTSLETGGTESGEIRKIVWKGAVEIWKSNPILGTGPETFALSYFKFKPKEHNLTSEWDFVYNKAHNEYLNYLANTGAVGFLSYLLLISASLFVMAQNTKNEDLLKSALLSGYLGFLVTNFFGFSVVVTNLLMFLFPAFAITLDKKLEKEDKKTYNSNALFLIIFLISTLLTFQVIKYWQADVAYNQGKSLNKSKNYFEAKNKLTEAIQKNPYQPIYYEETSRSSIGMTLVAYEQKQEDLAAQFATDAINQIEAAIKISPNNFFFRKTYSSIIIKLSLIDPNYQDSAEKALNSLLELAPTDPKIYYNLGLLYARKGEWQKAQEMLATCLDLKPNYKEGRLAIATVYKKLGRIEKAKEELTYILEKIDPSDAAAKRELEELK